MGQLAGADVAALRRFAADCDRRRHAIDAVRTRLGARLESLAWTGPDRERFLGEWRSVHAVALAAVAAELAAAARRAGDHAARQEQAARPW
jgi:hypothetical protein